MQVHWGTGGWDCRGCVSDGPWPVQRFQFLEDMGLFFSLLEGVVETSCWDADGQGTTFPHPVCSTMVSDGKGKVAYITEDIHKYGPGC